MVHLCAQRQELVHPSRLFQQCWLTLLPSLPLISQGVSLYVVGGGSQQDRMIPSDCPL